MTTIVLERTSSAYVSQVEPTKRFGDNPSQLGMKNLSGQNRSSFVKFAIPAIVFDPTTVIASAAIVVRNAYSMPGQTLAASRVDAVWYGVSINWDNRPGVTGTAANVTKSGTQPAGTEWSMNVLSHLQALQVGGWNRGWRITTSDTSLRYLYNRQAGLEPRLVITYYAKPLTPNAASPTDGQVVSVAKPTLRMSGGAASDIASVQFKVSANADMSSAWDSGTIPSSETSIDLSAYGGAPAASVGVPMYWQGRWTNAGGATSGWSTPAQYTYRTIHSVSITVPADSPNNTVTDPTPPIGWSNSGGITQSQYRFFIEDPDQPAGSFLWDSGQITSAALTDQPDLPVLTETGKTYRVRVRTWDAYDRVADGGVPAYAEATKDFTFVLSGTVDPVTSLVATNLDPLPYVKLSFDRSTAADYFQIVRDGVAVAVLDAVDIFVSGTSYEWIDYEAPPYVQHTWIVRALVNGVTSSANPDVTMKLESGGLWLSEPETETYVPLITVDSQRLNLSEEGSTFRVLGARYAVRIRSGLNGYEGQIVGELMATPLSGVSTGMSIRDDFLAIREMDLPRLILTMADLSIPVQAYDMSVAPTPHRAENGDLRYVCSFNFHQVP